MLLSHRFFAMSVCVFVLVAIAYGLNSFYPMMKMTHYRHQRYVVANATYTKLSNEQA